MLRFKRSRNDHITAFDNERRTTSAAPKRRIRRLEGCGSVMPVPLDSHHLGVNSRCGIRSGFHVYNSMGRVAHRALAGLHMSSENLVRVTLLIVPSIRNALPMSNADPMRGRSMYSHPFDATGYVYAATEKTAPNC